MELRQLEYLVAVVEEGTFTQAAARVHVAQPGVSAQVRQLERELGQPLLERSPRGVRLTEVGAVVLPYARAALQAVAGARHAVEELTGLLRGHVTIGTVPSISPRAVDLPSLLADFNARHPAVEITLSEGDTDRLLDALADGRLDLALVGEAGGPSGAITTQIIADEPLVAAVGRDHPFAARRTIRLAALSGEPLISLPRGSGLRRRLDEAGAAAGFEPRIAFEASDPRVLAQLAAHGLGIAILTQAAAELYAEIHPVAITHPRLRARLRLAWRTQGPGSPAARALISHARGRLGERAAGQP